MPDISKRLERAEKYVQKGRLDSAIEEYLAAWKEDPQNDSVVEMVAELYARQNQPTNALECYGYLFDKYAERGDGAKAAMVFRRMAKLGPQDPARVLAFAGFQEKQKPDEAQESYRQAAQLFLERGDKLRALDALRGYAGLNDLDPEAHIQVGEVAESLGQKEVAAQSFARAGELLRANHSGDRAQEVLERAQALVPSDSRVAQGLAAMLFESGHPRRAAELLEPFSAEAVPERNRLLAQAHLATGNLARAEELLWAVAGAFPEAHQKLLGVVEGHLRSSNTEAALSLLRKLKKAMFAARQDREFISFLEGLEKKNLGGIEVLEFLAYLYNELNYDSLFSGSMSRLFDLYVDAGQYEKAANALDHLVDLDSYDAENSARLQRLAGKVDDRKYQALISRLRLTDAPVPGAPEARPPAPAEQPAEEAVGGGESKDDSGSDALEDLILQAEIFLQYGLKARAVERLQKIARLAPGEESRNDKLRSLYSAAQFTPKRPPKKPSPTSPGCRKSRATSTGKER